MAPTTCCQAATLSINQNKKASCCSTADSESDPTRCLLTQADVGSCATMIFQQLHVVLSNVKSNLMLAFSLPLPLPLTPLYPPPSPTPHIHTHTHTHTHTKHTRARMCVSTTAHCSPSSVGTWGALDCSLNCCGESLVLLVSYSSLLLAMHAASRPDSKRFTARIIWRSLPLMRRIAFLRGATISGVLLPTPPFLCDFRCVISGVWFQVCCSLLPLSYLIN